MSELVWAEEKPTEPGWYWVRWGSKTKTLGGCLYFDGSLFEMGCDSRSVKAFCRFYGPVNPPEDLDYTNG